VEPDSAYRPGQPGNDFKVAAAPLAGEPVVVKHTNSAFIGTDFEKRLRTAGHERLVMCGVITNNSVEATVRAAEILVSKRIWWKTPASRLRGRIGAGGCAPPMRFTRCHSRTCTPNTPLY